MKKIRSPFKFLDSFTQADRSTFFGRDNEIETLYRMVQKTPLLLLYGLSGTGKTSLIQCGLAGKFDGTDWLPFWIRREDDFNHSLQKALDAPLAGIGMPANGNTSTAGKIKQLYSHFLRPVFLIFDQFEELYILGDAEERAKFVADLKIILEAELPCTVLLSVREEYIGQLYPLEKEIPSLFNFRMRVERMDTAHVTEVLSQSFRCFNISLEPPESTRYAEIIENISQTRSGIDLPYLQVYLDRIYRDDHARTYPGGTDLPEGQWPPLEFSKSEIAGFGTIIEVLDNFLREQREALRSKLLEQFSKEKIPENTVDQLLDAFVSAEGTKRPIGMVRENGLVVVGERQRALFPPISPEILTFCIERLEQARLLRSSDTSIELAHDTLAAAIEKQRSAEQRQLAEVRRRIDTAYREHADSGGVYFFDKGQLARIEPFLPKLSLEPEQADFLEKSRVEAERLENAEKERVAKELQLAGEKLAVEQRASEQQRVLTRLAEEARETALAEKRRAEAVLDKIYFYKDEFGLAYDKVRERYGFIDKNLNTKIEFIYAEAVPFEDNGYAKVKREDTYYLIDTLGKEYKLATEVNQLNSKISALDLRSNKLKVIPSVIFQNKQLKVLLLDFNSLTTLPDSIAALSDLKSLFLSNNRLKRLPVEIGKLEQLQSLDLSYNQLTSLPPEIGKLEQLQSLDLIQNVLTSLPVEIGKLEQLESLRLSYNRLASLPPEIGKLQQLQTLDLIQNVLTRLPVEIGNLQQLKFLRLLMNPLRDLPPEIGKLQQLQSLNLSRNELKSLPPEIGKLQQLKSLHLGFNKLKSLPVEIVKLQQLQFLSLSTNELKSLPVEIIKLQQLQTLDLSDNQLKSLPSEIGKLQQLQSLALQNNPLRDLPPEIGALQQLQSLYLSNNQLASLPVEITKLQRLQILDL